MGFNQPASLTLPASTATAVTLFRQACWPVWADMSTVWAQAVDYPMQYVVAPTAATTNADLTLIPRPNIMSWAIENRLATNTAAGLAGFSSTSSYSYPLLGVDRGTPGAEYTYVPAGGTFCAVLFSTVAPSQVQNFVLNWDEWRSPGETSNVSFTGSTAAGYTGGFFVAPQVPRARWVRPTSVSVQSSAPANLGSYWYVTIISTTSTGFSYAPSAVTAGIITITDLVPKFAHFPLVQPAEFANSSLPWYATRVTASAILGTNVSQVLNKGGTILGGRLSPAVYNAWEATSAIISNLHPAEKAYLPLETGVYTYAPPSTDLVFFSDYTLNTGFGAPMAPLFVLSNDSLYNKMFITAAAVSETLACTVSWHTEFRTSSALFQIGLSAMTIESLHAAQLVLAESGFFFENPEHDGLLNKVIATAKKFAPTVVGAINPMAGRLLTSVLSKMSDKKVVKPKPGPSKPKSTSAKGSGIEPKPTAKKAKPKAGTGKKK